MDEANNKDIYPGLQLRRMGGKRAEASPPLALDVESAAPSSNRLGITPSSSSSSSSDNHFNGFRFHFPGFVKRHQRSSRRCDTNACLDKCGDGNDDDDYASSSSSSSSVIFSPRDKSSWRSSPRGRSGHKAATRNSSFPTMKRMKSLFKHHKAPLRSTKKLRLDCVDFSGEDEDASIHPAFHKSSKPLTSTEHESCSLPHTELASDLCIIDDGLSAIIRQMFKENDHSHNNGTCEGNKCFAATENARSILDNKQFPDNQSLLTNGMKNCDAPNKEKRSEAAVDGKRVFEDVDRPGSGSGLSLHKDGDNYPRSLEVAPCGVADNGIEGAFNCKCQFCKGRRICKQTSRSAVDFMASKMPSKKASRIKCVLLSDDQDDTSGDPRRSFVKAECPSKQQEEECQRASWYNGGAQNGVSVSNHARCHRRISTTHRRPKRYNCSRNVFGFVETSSSSSEKDETDDDSCVVRPTASSSCSGSPMSRKLKATKQRPLRRNLYNSKMPKENLCQHPSSSTRQDYLDDVEVVPETPVGQRRRHCNFRLQSDSSSSESFEPNNIPKQKSSFDCSPVFGNHSKVEIHESQSNDSGNMNPQTSEMVTCSPLADCHIQDTSPVHNVSVMDEIKRSRQMELDEAYARALQAQLNSEGFQPGCNGNEVPTVNRSTAAVGRHFSSQAERPVKFKDNCSMKKLQELHKSSDRLNGHRHCKNDFEVNGSHGNRRNPLGIDEMSFGMPPSSSSQPRSHRSASCRSPNKPVDVECRERIPVGRQCGYIGCSSDVDALSMTERLNDDDDDDDNNNNMHFVLRPLLNERCRSGSRSQLGRRVSRSVHAPDFDNEPEILGITSILGGTSQSQSPVSRSWSSDVNGRGLRRGLRMPGTFSSPTDRTQTNHFFNSRESPDGSRSNDEDAPSTSQRLRSPLHLRLSGDRNFDRDLNSSTALPSPGEFEAVNSVLQMEMDEAYARMLQAQFNAETQMPTLSEPASSVTDLSFSANQRLPQTRMRSNNISGNQPQGIRQSGRRTPTQQPLLNPARHRTSIGRLRYPVEEIGIHRAQFPSGLEEPILAYPISPRRTRSQTRRTRSTAGILGHQDNFRNVFAPAAFGIGSDESDSDYELQTLVSHNDDFDNMYLLLGPILSPSRGTGGRSLVGRRNQRRGRLLATGNDYEEMLELDEQLGHVSKGLTRGQMNRLPTHSFRKGTKNSESGSSNCHICMSDYEEGEMLRVLPCFHEFHMQCIDKWLWEKDTCPICRLNVVAN